MKDVYLCDPVKNIGCPKTGCFINGGDCRYTTHEEYAFDSKKPVDDHSVAGAVHQARILHHLLSYGSITSKEAFDLYGETRLSGRIYDLKKKGFKIGKRMIDVENRYNEKRKVAKYYLINT